MMWPTTDIDRRIWRTVESACLSTWNDILP